MSCHRRAFSNNRRARNRNRHRRAFAGRVPLPLELAGFRIHRFQIALNVEIVTADADKHVVADYDGAR